ncbi:MAG TPA: hypothetical protein VJB90_03115 [Candidatus Nanoarchaeia archaeon]|nr:hypothetical protein [Candidatus Nanoarchaeia archaeon]
MASIDVENHIEELKGFAGNAKDVDLYSLKKELTGLSEASHVFDNFEKESMSIGREELSQMQNLSLLIKIRKLACEIKDKKQINDRLHSLHFNLNMLKNADAGSLKPIKSAFDAFLHNNETKIDNIISELNDFKTKIDGINKHHSNLLPRSLDNKLKIDGKYGRHIEKLHSIHKKQKNALVSTIRLFLKMAKKHIKSLKRFKNIG